jgi:pantothenate kinase-related protein Tda10
MCQIVRDIEILDYVFSRNEVLKPILITFSGIDGAGKSTQIQKLREYLTTRGVSVRQTAFWDQVAVLRNARSGFSRHVLQSEGRVGSRERPAVRRDKKEFTTVCLFLTDTFLTNSLLCQ